MAGLLLYLGILLVGSARAIDYNLTVADDDTYLRYPDDFNCSSESINWEINVVEKYLGLAVYIYKTNLDPDNGEHLVLSADPTFSGETASVRYFTGILDNVKLAIPLTNKAYLRFNSNEVCNSSTVLTILFKPYEKAKLEGPPTTPNPNPPSYIKTDILIYLAGRTLLQFNDETFLENFKEKIQDLAFSFAARNNIGYEGNKSASETVFLRQAQTCPRKWSNYESCVSVWMSVYVTKPRVPYEFTITHLEQFWDTILVSGLPKDLLVQPYEFPSVASEIWMWILWISIAIAITFISGCIFCFVEKRSKEIELYRQEEAEYRRYEEKFENVELRRPRPPLPTVKKFPTYIEKEKYVMPEKKAATKNKEGKSTHFVSFPTEPTTSSPVSPVSPVAVSPTSPKFKGKGENFFINDAFVGDGDDDDDADEISVL